MFNRIIVYALHLLCMGIVIPAIAQAPECTPDDAVLVRKGEVFFSYGNANNAYTIKNRSSYTIGQPVVGFGVSPSNNSMMGFWSRLFIPPLEPAVTASQGELLDRIQLSWQVEPLGAQPTSGFKLYRDGVFLALLDNNTRNYNDFNVIAGRVYNYEVRGINLFGEGRPGKAIGFQVPNGVVTGWVQTVNGSAVTNAIITLMPMQGFSAAFGPQDAAFAEADTSGNPFMPAPGGDWTITYWIKTDSALANAGILELSPFPLYFRALQSSGGQEGVEISTSAAGAPFLSGAFTDSTKNGWHHVALSFDGSGEQGRLFIDGILAAQAPMNIIAQADLLNLGSQAGSGGWTGKLDELRIYHQQLDELDYREVMDGTASSLTPNLSHYWKMDEQQGIRSYDILNRHKLYFCGATFDAERPPVHTSGKTNDEGYYRIESASYGTGTTFLANPMKDFYMHRALKIVRDETDYATLPDFSVTSKATLELWLNSAGPDGEQCLISKRWPGNDFRLLLKQNGLESEVWFYLNGQEHNFGALGMGYQHLAFTLDSISNSRTVAAYKNGIPFGTPHTFACTGNFSDTTQNWILGARPSGGAFTDHYGGLLDEVALYDTILNIDSILSHFQQSRNMQGKGLRVYYSLDEGNGIRLNNSGSAFLGSGTNMGADWSPFAANQMTEPHEFTPVTRQVTLNPSVTSVDGVDFVDRSSVAVSGYVRYKNTDCFAPNVEILVNGASFAPKIFTDSTGKFTIDFDPGTTATLTPVFENHLFVPAFWDVTNVVSPIAGILFNDITTRSIKGRIAGGLCKKSVIEAPPGMGQGTVCIVKVASVDGCLVRQIILDNQEGDYEFASLPPLKSLTVAVVEHSDPDVKAAFQVLGGSTVNLTQRDTIIDFTYFAPPEVAINSGLDPFPGCPDTYVLDKGEFVELKISMVEQYVQIKDNMGMILDDGVCPLDTAHFNIINGFADMTLDTAMSNGELKYKFQVGNPNPSPPYLKTLQIIGVSLANREGSLTKQAIVTGIVNKNPTFATILPETPTLILRDPPGDGSSSFLQENTKICNTYTFAFSGNAGIGGGAEIHLGGDIEIVAAPLGVGTIVNSGPIIDSEIKAIYTLNTTSDSTLQSCVSYDTKVSTSSGGVFVGEDADLYMGQAIDIRFGFADEVTFDTCVASTSVLINIEPGDQPTTFIYSQAYINGYQIPYLTKLRDDPLTDSLKRLDYDNSITRWTNIVARNKGLKEKAKFKRNISFDALNSFDYAETSENVTNNSSSNGSGLDLSNVSHIGFQLADFGVQAIIDISSSTSTTTGNGVEQSAGVTTGFTLADDDPFDAFSVTVLMDSVYNTPVFKTYAGQSSCPWEEGTANREGPNLALDQGSQFTAINVPAHDPAVFKMSLGNLSATNEDWTYGFTAIAASNPHGAIIKLNGQPLNNNTIQYIVPYGTTIPITLTVERGPIEYDYDDLVVALVSECEMARNFALSLPLDNDPKFFSSINLGAHFIRPCSEVDINAPEQNWVVLNNDPIQPGTLRRITVSGYDLNSTDFQLVRVQYRRSDGDGAWINIPNDVYERYNPNWDGYDLLPDPKPPALGASFTQFFWETEGLSDGPYEIHAWAVCTGDATDMPGFSEIIKGRIDREPPSLVGVPQPSDGVYNVGDEISFTFNKPINCDKIIQADITQANNVGLYDATTGLLIDIDFTCYENKIILDPNFQNEFFENRILRAELHSIEDLTGNESTFLKWEFYVDRNELGWLTDSLGMTKYEDQTKTVVANIHNRGGYPVPFTIQDIPAWVHVVPNQGTLAPNEIRPISFTVDSSLAFGLWSDSITLHTETGQNPFFMGGDEGLPVGVRVICRPPNTDLNAGIFENSENMVLQLNIQGELSTDVEDMVFAFIGDTLCGRANVQYVPELNKYLAYLTIYGNPNHVLDTLRLEIWDASACLRYAVQENDFLFQPDDVIGDPLSPQVIHTNSLVLREVPLGFGWNWLSFNLDFPDPEINAALATLNHPENDLMKGQNSFSTHLVGGGWLGSLNTLGNTSMYIYRADKPDTLMMVGNVISPANTPIPVVTGWNWIGYVPNYSLPVNEALSSLSPQTGDLIKGQLSFAQYINSTFGWIGNLKFMSPPNGYQLKLSTPGTLIYPASSNLTGGGAAEILERGPGQPPVSFWNVDATQYEHSMTLIGMFKLNGINATTATMELGAFAGGQVRGTGQAIYIEPLQAYLFFMTVYANTSGEQIRYKLFDNGTGEVQDLSEIMTFSPDLHQGSIEAAVPFSLLSSGTQEAFASQSLDVHPNPFHTETLIRFALTETQEVHLSITDINGKLVAHWGTPAREGMNTMVWKGISDSGSQLPSGVYFIRLQTESGSVVKKVVLQ